MVADDVLTVDAQMTSKKKYQFRENWGCMCEAYSLPVTPKQLVLFKFWLAAAGLWILHCC
ncbi:unnamed protein product [Lathyrus oleraceus]